MKMISTTASYYAGMAAAAVLVTLAFVDARLSGEITNSVEQQGADDLGIVSTYIEDYEDPLFEEQAFQLIYKDHRDLREFDEHGRRLLTRTLEWPECKGMGVWQAKSYIEDYMAKYNGHVLKDMQLVVRQPRAASSRRSLAASSAYHFSGVRANFETIGQHACDRFNGAVVDNQQWTLADGSSSTVPDINCLGKTTAECCNLIWEQGETMGLDANGKHLTCYVYQEPSYPFFDEADNNLLKYSDYYFDSRFNRCRQKKYRIAPLQRQYQKVADKIVEEVVEMIENLFEPVALRGYCKDRSGADQNDGVIALKQGKGYGPSDALKQECFDMCVAYEENTGTKLTGCEAIWGSHAGRGCYGHTEEVFRGSGGRLMQRACWVDPIRPTDAVGSIKCDDLKFIMDNIYNYARVTTVNGLMGRLASDYLEGKCGNSEEVLYETPGLKNLLLEIKNRVTYSGPDLVPVTNFVYIVGDKDGVVASTPRVASNNPALHPILWNNAAAA